MNAISGEATSITTDTETVSTSDLTSKYSESNFKNLELSNTKTKKAVKPQRKFRFRLMS